MIIEPSENGLCVVVVKSDPSLRDTMRVIAAHAGQFGVKVVKQRF